MGIAGDLCPGGDRVGFINFIFRWKCHFLAARASSVRGGGERKAAKKKGKVARLGLRGIKAPVRLRFTQFMIRSLKGLTLGKEVTATRAVTNRSVIGRTRIEKAEINPNSSSFSTNFFIDSLREERTRSLVFGTHVLAYSKQLTNFIFHTVCIFDFTIYAATRESAFERVTKIYK